MFSAKRIVITTASGLSFGALAVGLVTLGMGGLPPEISARMMISLGFMGFVIGISSLPWHWAINGLVIGGIVGLIEGLASFVVGGDLLFPLLGSMIFGLLIELIATVIFKAGAHRNPAAQ